MSGARPYFRSKEFRQDVYETAYHEAGHVVARMFTGYEAAHHLYATIIPDAVSLGRERSGPGLRLEAYADFPEQVKRSALRQSLLHILAGRAAQYRVALKNEREDILDWDSEECYSEGTDLFRADLIASILARKHMPKDRILALAEKWTVEMLAIPKVWVATKTIAEELLKTGTIEADRTFNLCEPISNLSFRLPLWKKRLHQRMKETE